MGRLWNRVAKRIGQMLGCCVVRSARVLGVRCYLRAYVWLLKRYGVTFEGPPDYIGRTCRLDTHAPIKIGRNVIISEEVFMLTHDYCVTTALRAGGDQMREPSLICGGITIGDNCFIGLRATLLPGTVLGDNVIVGAGAVVRGSIPDGVIVIGNPAQSVCTTNEYAQKKKHGASNTQILDERDLPVTRPVIVHL